MQKYNVIILGAGRPFRGEYPSALVKTSGNNRVLDWIFGAFDCVINPEFHFVGGYGLNEIIKNYPDLRISVNPKWETTRSLGSLMISPLSTDQTTFVCYADVLFRKKAVQLVEQIDDDVVIAVDRDWRDRYESRSKNDLDSAEKVIVDDGKVLGIGAGLLTENANAEFAGLMKLSPGAVAKVIDLFESAQEGLDQENIPYLIDFLGKNGFSVRAVEIEGDWAELNAPQDLAHFVFGTKAETLERLRPLLKHSVIDDQISFTVEEWNNNQGLVLDRIRAKFEKKTLVVRSSALGEDNWSSSGAGIYTSLLDIPGHDSNHIVDAINRVIESYTDKDMSHQVLVQPMLTSFQMSGVVFTRTLHHGAPYYTINYDDTSSDTQSVTSGTGKDLKTVVIHRGLESIPMGIDSRISHLLKAIKELEELVGYDYLDIEFAITGEGGAHIFQLRPITVNRESSFISDSHIDRIIQTSRKSFRQRQKSGPFVLGRKTFFGVMPDWNPAEIIGIKPRRLALTLYQHLFMDDVWAEQRVQYGYRDVRPHPLLVTFGGHPYIDVRASFNSFIPGVLPTELAERLVDHYLKRLEADPYLHDKIEFDIVFTCFTFDFEQKSQRLLRDGFTQEDLDCLRGGLIDITIGAMERWEQDLKSIEKLQQRFELLRGEDMDPLDLAYILLEDCKRYGALPFAHLARAGFVAISLLNSLQTIKIITSTQNSGFLNSLETVATRFQRDGSEVATGRMDWEKFVDTYGHLRPGTYEITSPTYAEDPDRFLKPLIKNLKEKTDKGGGSGAWDDNTRSAIAMKLKENGLPDDFAGFENFLRGVIEGREYAKFVFSRNLSLALDSFIRFGERHGVSREQLSHISFKDLQGVRTGKPLSDINEWLTGLSDEGKKWSLLAQAMELPPLLFNEDNLAAFQRPQSQPNFVTRGRVLAKTVNLANEKQKLSDPFVNGFTGKIIMIPQADPGFDWLFGHNIGALVTMYGGANSHMSIRAAEFGVPAAIGVGEILYNKLIKAETIEIDCAAHLIRVIK